MDPEVFLSNDNNNNNKTLGDYFSPSGEGAGIGTPFRQKTDPNPRGRLQRRHAKTKGVLVDPINAPAGDQPLCSHCILYRRFYPKGADR